MTLENIQLEILEIHGSLSLRPTWKDAARIGELLSKAKKLVTHGRWQSWLGTCGMRRRTAQTYMQVFAHAKNAELGVFDDKPLSIEGFLRMVRKSRREFYKAERDKLRRAAIRANVGVEDQYAVHQADCRKFDWPASIDYVWTDPPWNERWAYEWLADFGSRHLRPGGLLVVQCGQAYLPFVLATIGAKLNYHWTMAIVYDQVYPTNNLPFANAWRPVVVYSKGKWDKTPFGRISDTVTVRDNEDDKKQYHAWQQPIQPHTRWISTLTLPGSLIVDPFVGSGTNGVACKMVGARRFIGVDIDQVAVARKRIAETVEGSMEQ
jgi:16S rRNA G966 N2-methylase RsmD